MTRPISRRPPPASASSAIAPSPAEGRTGPALPPGDDQLLTDRQLAARWSCSAKTLRNHRSAGEGCPFVRLGRLVRYRLSDVLEAERAGSR
jgi:hypothetical protein